MTIGCPVVYFEKNMYFNDKKECWAAYKLEGFNYAFQSDPTKINILVRQVQIIKNVTHAKILVIPTSEDIDKHAAKVRKRIRKDDTLSEAAKIHLEKTSEYLKQMGKEYWNEYTTYLLIKLQEPYINEMEMVGRELLQFFREPLYNIQAYMGLQPDDITTLKYRQFSQKEIDIYRVLNTQLSMQRTTTAETQWLLKRVNYRGTDKPIILNQTNERITNELTGVQYTELTENWKPEIEQQTYKSVTYLRPDKKQVANLFDGIISNNRNKGIKVTHDDDTISYQSFLVITNIPRRYDFPGKEWIYLLQKEPIQTELCIDIKNIHNKAAQEELNNKTIEVNTQLENLREAGARQIPDELKDAYNQIPELNRELNVNGLPMSEVCISLCVSGTNEQTVEDNIKHLKAYFSSNGFNAVRPGADQRTLFFQHIPGTPTFVECFKIPFSPFVVASGIFGAVNRVGDTVGYYIGTADGKPVYLYLGQACKDNKSPACLLIGDLGYGKSFNANLLLFLHVLYGGYGFVICPKGERKEWDKLPYIGKYVNKVSLTTDDENKGKLDPYNIYRNDIEYASSLASTVITELLNLKQDSNQYVVLNECINELKKHPCPSMKKLVALIGRVDKKDDYYTDARKLYRNLSAILQTGHAKLVFGDGTEEAIQITGRLNLIMLSGVTFPEKDVKKEDYTIADKLAMMMLLLISSFIKKFSLMHPNTFKVTLVDESWALSSNPTGASMIEWVSRQGRSLFSSIILNGHSVLDLPSEKLRTAITYKFCFHTSDRDEAVRMLELLKIDTSEENINTLMNLKNRQCLFSDQSGRVAKLTFDAVFGDLITAFSTTPEEESEKKQSKPIVQQEQSDIEDTSIQEDDIILKEIDELIAREQVAV